MEAPCRLSKRAASILKSTENVRELSSISLTEIAVKATSGKLSASEIECAPRIEDLDVRILPFAGDHAFQLLNLPAHHRDPFDRQIIAHALAEDIPVLSPDERLGLYKGLKVIW